MKVRLIKGFDGQMFQIEPEKSELTNLEELRDLIQDKVSKALDMADKIWKDYPDFKQITLDTVTDEERKLMAQAKKVVGGGN